MHKIFLSPSNQDDNVYAAGDTTEAAQCGRIAEAVKAALIRCGFEVMVMHMEPKATKCSRANAWGAEAYIPIHTNASVLHNATGTRLYCSRLTGSGAKICEAVSKYLYLLTPGAPDLIKEGPTLAEVKTPNAPTCYIEVDFHDVPEVAQWLIDNTDPIGEAIAHGICDYFGEVYVAPDQSGAAPEPIIFNNVDELPKWARADIAWLISKNYLHGDANGNLALTPEMVRLLCIAARMSRVEVDI